MEEGESAILSVCMERNEKCNAMHPKIIKMLLIMSVEVAPMRRTTILVNE
ncbi:hypothetical protein BC30048_1941 [Bacillus cereus]|nr:hypothetical protein BwiPL1_47590 [Bacillus wiedmannii]BCC99038.1 hypothetical protein BC30048_1941 [Bacillus cereus]BCT40644.1 hypothetical protein WHT_c20730 [Bacillus cereus]GCF81327.1 hypothetical protein BCACH14_33030 [Bacillus cereus]GMB75562.1 hypothetical protein BCER1_19630 [Bacillus cereus]